VKFQWIDECENSFSTLKKSLVTAPIITLPELGKCFIVYFDASLVGLGCALCKMESLLLMLIGNWKGHKQNYSTHDLELPADVFAL
jgi:hypothetical protein